MAGETPALFPSASLVPTGNRFAPPLKRSVPTTTVVSPRYVLLPPLTTTTPVASLRTVRPPAGPACPPLITPLSVNVPPLEPTRLFVPAPIITGPAQVLAPNPFSAPTLPTPCP